MTETWGSLVQNSSADQFWIFWVLIVGLAIACGLGIFYFVRRSRIIQDTPTSKIRSAAQGYVEINGQLHYLANEPLIAPLTGTPCAWYRYRIEQEQTVHTGRSSHRTWRTIEDKISERAFVCQDATGSCMVDPRHAEIHTQRKDVWYGYHRWPEQRSNLQGWSRSGDYRYTEERLHERDPLYILGLFRTVDPNKAEGDINEQTRSILKMWKQDQAALLQKFDSNGDGQVDLQEWEDVRAAAQQHAYQQMLAKADRPAVHFISSSRDFRRPYIISTRPEKKMVANFKLKAAACTIGFVLAMPVAVWMLLLRLSA